MATNLINELCMIEIAEFRAVKADAKICAKATFVGASQRRHVRVGGVFALKRKP